MTEGRDAGAVERRSGHQRALSPVRGLAEAGRLGQPRDGAQTEIPLEEIRWHHAWTGADNYGRLFEWQGQLYRGIRASYEPVYTRLFGTGLAQRLSERGLLVESDPTSYKLEGFAWVVKHRRIPFVSYPYEWSPLMLREAALTVLALNLELAEHDLFVQDPNAWNILLDGPRALFIDLCSIRLFDDAALWPSPWPAYEHFCRHFLYPLALIADGHERIVRSLLRDWHPGVLPEEFAALRGRAKRRRLERITRSVQDLAALVYRGLPPTLRPLARQGLQRARAVVAARPATRRARRAFLEDVRREIEALNLSARSAPRRQTGNLRSPGPAALPVRQRHLQYVQRVVRQYRPQRVLDLHCGDGLLAEAAAAEGCAVVACGADSLSIDALFKRAQSRRLAILPLVMDLKNPSPASGVCNRKYAAATDRLASDLVLALDLVHHLALRRTLDFDHIVEALSQFTRRWLLVEFVSGDDSAGHPEWREWYPWYTWENFLEALGKHFATLDVLGTDTPSRRVVLAEKPAT